jgi:hypothetical protein
MRLGIMQPYFLPYLGYFQLIFATDTWIVFDTPQYIRHGWINRNRILKPDGKDWQYISIPIKKHSREAKIKDIEISYMEDWKTKITAQLSHYKIKAPYYSATMDVINQCINTSSNSIVDLNINAIKSVCDYLNIKFNYNVHSHMNLTHDTPTHAGEWALHTCTSIGAKEYINPPGGREIFDKGQFINAGIDLFFLETQFSEYNQRNKNFIKGLSIIDVMMFNSAKEIAQMLCNFELT